MKLVAVLLSGGSAYGAVQVHAMEQIVALHGPAVTHWAGVSVGAQHALLGAQGRVSRARELWRDIDGLDWFMRPAMGEAWRLIRSLGRDPVQAVYTLEPLARRIRKELVHSLKWTCEVGVTDYEVGPTYRQINLRELTDREDIVAAMCASGAQPVIHQGWRAPIQTSTGMERRMCFDGGVKHVIPTLDQPERFGFIYVVLCSPPTVRQRRDRVARRKVDGLIEVAERSAETWTDAVVEADVDRVRSWSSPSTKVILVAPEESPGDAFDASRRAILWRLNDVGPTMWRDRVTLCATGPSTRHG